MAGPTRSEEFSGAGTMELGQASPGKISRWLVHIEGTGWTGSVTPKAKSVGDGDLTAIAIAFYDVAAGETTTTAPTDDAILLVDSTGLDVELAVTATAGSVSISAVPVVG